MTAKVPFSIFSPCQVGLLDLQGTNPTVSAKSRFNDPIWDFTTEVTISSLSICEKRINWDWTLPNGQSFPNPVYSSLLLTLKELTYLLIHEIAQAKPQTIVSRIYNLRVFVTFITTKQNPVYRFSDVLASDIKAFFTYLKTRLGNGRKEPLSSKTLMKYYLDLNNLYDYRSSLSDGLTVRASGEATPHRAAVKGITKQEHTRTQPIPDDVAEQLLGICIDYVDIYAPILFETFKRLQKLKRRKGFQSQQSINHGYTISFFEKCTSDMKLKPNSLFRLVTIHHLIHELANLRLACFIIIGFCTGMRLSEILSIKFGCIKKEVKRNHGTFYWLSGISYKTEPRGTGVQRTWMCGELSARAVKILEGLSVLIGAQRQTNQLFSTIPGGIEFTAEPKNVFKPITGTSIQLGLKRFCHKLGINVLIHPHMFRRTFARNIVRFSDTSLLALKEHFKHWSLYMTDWYVGLDPDLIGELEAERQMLSIELMDKICVSQVSGPGGRRWTVELDARIKQGLLPKNFRAKAGSEYRKTLINELHEAGTLVIPCGDFTYCMFNKDKALCTKGQRPIPNICKPTACSNSYITKEHVPAHEERLAEFKALYEGLSDSEKLSPLGQYYLGEISGTRKAIEPLKKVQ